MNTFRWVLLVLIPIVLALVALLWARNAASRDEAAEGRLAIKQLANEKGKRQRGSMRGAGSEGDRNMPYQAAFGSDTSSGA
ncbi:hypothetical protein [Micromonospora fulviviridis]|uniref:Uncharacterized protein n=1 Tax=Micromonospora fulviviridis TaxID=47860 RepID=A0ABV2VM41_9ACTN